MGNTQNVIEINGKRYDARTGELLRGQPRTAPLMEPIKKPAGTQVDGIARRKDLSVSKTAPRHVHSAPQRSTTLMRKAVKKPATNSHITVNTSHSAPAVAATHTKSPFVSKFAAPSYSGYVVKKVQPLHVQPEKHHTAQAKPAANHPTHTTVTSSVVSHASAAISSVTVTADKILDNALAQATSHLAPVHKTKRQRTRKLGLTGKVVSIGLASVSVLLLGTFFAYQNVPNFAMRVAAARAGVAASMPAYQPSGFSFRGPIRYSSGEVVVNFASNTNDDRAFALTQRASSWNNDALLANYVLPNDNQYQTFQDRNLTIYMYGGTNATWIAEGIWYQLEGSANLTSDQVVRLASSL